MRFNASAWATDSRPEKPDNAKDADKPKGGWRTKSGVRKLGNQATIEADSFSEAVEKTAALIGSMPDKVQSQVVRVRVEADPTDPEQDGNPFLS